LKAYSGQLTEDLKIQLQNPAGKPIKGLPSMSDETTKASKKQLSTSRKELKQVVKAQSERLYEALCAERAWSAEEWQTHFSEHPIMAKLIQRVVWLEETADGKPIRAFRPTPEGELVNIEDEDAPLRPDSQVRVAHGASMSETEAEQWAEHLDDYEVEPLFIQFGRSLMRLPKDMRKMTLIEDRKGWITDTFTIRGVASKLGYDRGEALDGGYFDEYTRNFTSAGLQAVINFSGNCLPEENVAAAPISLSFRKFGKSRRMGSAVELKDVPAVMLSECWNDYHAMAGKGQYDPDWLNKMPWI
jgi:hypothetical protein